MTRMHRSSYTFSRPPLFFQVYAHTQEEALAKANKFIYEAEPLEFEIKGDGIMHAFIDLKERFTDEDIIEVEKLPEGQQ